MRRLMSWLMGSRAADAEKAASHKLGQAMAEQGRAVAAHTKVAVGATLAADDTREALDALLWRMERRQKKENEARNP